MCVIIRRGCLLLLLGLSVPGHSAFLSDEEASSVETGALAGELGLFQTIRRGILLSITQCEGEELCLGNLHRHEVEQLIDAIDNRVTVLTRRYEESRESGLEDILVAYVDEREEFNDYLERIKVISPEQFEDELDDEFGDEDIFGITTISSTAKILNQYRIYEDQDDLLADDEEGLEEIELESAQ